MTTDVAKQEESPSALYDYGEFKDTGWEGFDASHMAIPFLNILQSNSPEVEEEKVEGAKAGMLYNTVTQELIDGKKGIVFIPCYFEESFYIEWRPRDEGGGFVAMHKADSKEVQEAPAIVDPKTGKPTFRKQLGDNELVETFCVYGLTLDESGEQSTGFAALSFTSTKIKPYKGWMTSMRMLPGPPPFFSNRARIQTFLDKRAVNTFYNFQIRPFNETWLKSLIDPKALKGLIGEAVSFRKQVTDGLARANFDTTQEVEPSGEGKESDSETDDIPF